MWSGAAADTAVRAVAFSPAGETIASAAASSASGTLKLWKTSDGSLLVSSASTDPLNTLAFSADGLLIVTGGNNGDIGRLQIWDASNLGLLQTFDEETGTCPGSSGVTAVAVSPDDSKFLYGRHDGTVVLMDNPFWTIPTNLAVQEITGQVGELVVLKARLTTAIGGAPVLGKTVSFAVEGVPVGTGVTDAQGWATCDFRIPEELGVSERAINCEFAGDDAYAASTGANTLRITPANTGIIVQDVVGILGDPITLRAKLLRTTDDAPLRGRTLQFAVESSQVGSAVTGDDGWASVDYVIPIGSGGGQRLITVDFAGDANHRVCTAYGWLDAKKRPTSTTVTPRSAYIGVIATLSATVAFRGVGVEGVEVAFQVDGTDVETAVTDSSGTAEVGYLVSEGGGIGTRTIAASFAGTVVYEASSGTGALEVLRTPSRIYVPRLERTVVSGGTTVLRGYLLRTTDRGGIAGRSVTFYVEGTLVDVQITDADGRATAYYTVPPDMGSGDLTVRCTFDGDATYLPSEGSGVLTVIVQKVPTYLWVLPRIGLRGSATYLRGYLRRATDWSWLPGKTIHMSVDGTSVGAAVTNNDGRASLLYRVPGDMGIGMHVISMTFDGDAEYLGSTGQADMLIL